MNCIYNTNVMELLQKYPKADFSKLVALRLGDFLRDEGKEDEAIQTYKNAIASCISCLRSGKVLLLLMDGEDHQTLLECEIFREHKLP